MFFLKKTKSHNFCVHLYLITLNRLPLLRQQDGKMAVGSASNGRRLHQYGSGRGNPEDRIEVFVDLFCFADFIHR
jgi:hypothetical protein